MSIRPRLTHLGLASVLAAGAAFTAAATFAAADQDTAQACLDAGNVWVHVEYADTDAEGACATDFTTGKEALLSAGFVPAEDQFPGMVSSINGQPAEPGPEDWWSSWYMEPAADGTAGEWQFHEVGYTESQPEAGSVEAWRLQTSWSASVQPQVDPLAAGEEPAEPADPETPAEPETPADPETPAAPETPSGPAGPVTPGRPGLPSSGV